ncbi:MAG: ATP-binding protein [candidate division KSB1 bacterium]|nr:ATP-binding protein [candidate division KSB1 bacterium]MDQ7064450.1 ATP-binding protein [candidate division KSB1 bacterium]
METSKQQTHKSAGWEWHMPQPRPDQVDLAIPSDPRLLKIVRMTIMHLTELAGFGEEEQKSVALAVDEACSNIIKHAYGGATDRPIIIRFQLLDHGLRVLLRDYGRKADLSKIKSRELDDIRPGGLGVHLIRSVMDVVEYDNSLDEGNLLTLEKFLRR